MYRYEHNLFLPLDSTRGIDTPGILAALHSEVISTYPDAFREKKGLFEMIMNKSRCENGTGT